MSPGNRPCLALAPHLRTPPWRPLFLRPSRQALESNPELSTLVTALGTAGLLQSLGEPTLTYTVFAPTSEPLLRAAWSPDARVLLMPM